MTRFLTTTLMIAAFAIGSVIPSVAFAAGDVAAGKAKFQEASKPVWKAFGKRTKGNKKILDAVIKAKAEYKKSK